MTVSEVYCKPVSVWRCGQSSRQAYDRKPAILHGLVNFSTSTYVSELKIVGATCSYYSFKFQQIAGNSLTTPHSPHHADSYVDLFWHAALLCNPW